MNGPTYIDKLGELDTLAQADDDHHRNAPKGPDACLYGLVGEVARAASATTEANPHAVALNVLVYLAASVGRAPFLRVGNTNHHARLFGMHVGRSGRGRKGDALGIVHRIDMAVRRLGNELAPQVHRGGLSSREGLVHLIHDGFKDGKTEVAAIDDKRLWVVESEFANILQQSRRDGNTLSAALRDCWDGVDMHPATKTSRVWATNPHVNLSAAITPSELRSLMASRELSNGFANRFMVIWAERTKTLPFPVATAQTDVDAFAGRVVDVLRFAGVLDFSGECSKEMTLTDAAKALYADLYRGELDDQSAGERITGLMERRAPMLLRLAMLFAMTDVTTEIDRHHIAAALAWVRFWTDSVRYVFASDADESTTARVSDTATKIVDYLHANGRKTRRDLMTECFRGHASKTMLDAAIDELLATTPPTILVESVPRPKSSPGGPTKFYQLTANSANRANSQHSCGFAADSHGGEPSEACELSDTSIRSVRSVRNTANSPQTRANPSASQSSLNSHAPLEIGGLQ